MTPPLPRASLLLVAGLLAGCLVDEPYPCATTPQCVDSRHRQGACVAADGGSYCAFDDQTCPSGLRWHESAAPPLAATCVGLPAAGDGPAPGDAIAPDGQGPPV